MSPEPSNPLPRFRYEEVQLTPAESYEAWCRSVYNALARVKDLETELEEAKAELVGIQRGPEPATETVQVVLYPGDPGYDEAPLHLDPLYYQGRFEWHNIPIPES
jgi:hypothetical protein